MDPEARFRALFQQAYPRLHAYARHRGMTRSDADDLVAATLEVAWRRLVDVPVDDPMPWLYAVARNLWRNRLRVEVRRAALVVRLSTQLPQADEPQMGLDAGSLGEALGRLDEDDLEILRLVAWDGLSPSQAAVVLGCSAVAARTRLHRARRRLAKHLGLEPGLQRRGGSGQIPGAGNQNLQVEASDG